MGEKFKTLLSRDMFEPYVTRHPKTKGLPNNRIDIHMMSWRATRYLLELVCKEHLEKCPRAVCRGFLQKKKKKGKKCVVFFSL